MNKTFEFLFYILIFLLFEKCYDILSHIFHLGILLGWYDQLTYLITLISSLVASFLMARRIIINLSETEISKKILIWCFFSLVALEGVLYGMKWINRYFSERLVDIGIENLILKVFPYADIIFSKIGLPILFILIITRIIRFPVKEISFSKND